ncbi:flagellar hook-length control protein FliK [Yoonia sp. 208BN28-4]|uniref:flagellar hook-length control protein FliK n=1 Tax=Yoonia sp. 208BN28-4 TaxID=3126505 RepID=UPI0030A38BC6
MSLTPLIQMPDSGVSHAKLSGAASHYGEDGDIGFSIVLAGQLAFETRDPNLVPDGDVLEDAPASDDELTAEGMDEGSSAAAEQGARISSEPDHGDFQIRTNVSPPIEAMPISDGSQQLATHSRVSDTTGIAQTQAPKSIENTGSEAPPQPLNASDKDGLVKPRNSVAAFMFERRLEAGPSAPQPPEDFRSQVVSSDLRQDRVQSEPVIMDTAKMMYAIETNRRPFASIEENQPDASKPQSASRVVTTVLEQPITSPHVPHVVAAASQNIDPVQSAASQRPVLSEPHSRPVMREMERASLSANRQLASDVLGKATSAQQGVRQTSGQATHRNHTVQAAAPKTAQVVAAPEAAPIQLPAKESVTTPPQFALQTAPASSLQAMAVGNPDRLIVSTGSDKHSYVVSDQNSPKSASSLLPQNAPHLPGAASAPTAFAKAPITPALPAISSDPFRAEFLQSAEIPTSSPATSANTERIASVAPQSFAQSDHARQIAQQVAATITPLKEGVTEVTLRPEELGRVALRLTSGDGVMNLVVTAERPETADLMRRHIDLLSQEFRALGYADLNFSFGGDGHTPAHNDASNTAGTDAVDDAADADAPGQVTHATTGLDLRL